MIVTVETFEVKTCTWHERVTTHFPDTHFSNNQQFMVRIGKTYRHQVTFERQILVYPEKASNLSMTNDEVLYESLNAVSSNVKYMSRQTFSEIKIF